MNRTRELYLGIPGSKILNDRRAEYEEKKLDQSAYLDGRNVAQDDATVSSDGIKRIASKFFLFERFCEKKIFTNIPNFNQNNKYDIGSKIILYRKQRPPITSRFDSKTSYFSWIDPDPVP